MAENWAAVSAAIDERMIELGLNQRELAQRAGLALSIVRELRNNTVQRRRSGRTLEALSVALGWHPRHLASVLLERTPPAVDAPVDYAADSVRTRLAAIEEQLAEITKRLDELNTNILTVVERDNRER